MTHDHNHGTAGGAGRLHVHVTSIKMLVTVFLALVVLTWATVAVTYVNLGPANLWIALGVAVLKASLVALFFMHLKWDAPLNGFLLICSLAFVMLFIGLALTDGAHYQDEVVKGYGPRIEAARAAHEK